MLDAPARMTKPAATPISEDFRSPASRLACTSPAIIGAPSRTAADRQKSPARMTGPLRGVFALALRPTLFTLFRMRIVRIAPTVPLHGHCGGAPAARPTPDERPSRCRRSTRSNCWPDWGSSRLPLERCGHWPSRPRATSESRAGSIGRTSSIASGSSGFRQTITAMNRRVGGYRRWTIGELH